MGLILSSQNGNDRFRAGLPTLNVQLKAVNFEPMLWLEWKTIHKIGWYEEILANSFSNSLHDSILLLTAGVNFNTSSSFMCS